MRCVRCGKTCLSPWSESWKLFQQCPKCFNTTKLDAKGMFKDDTILRIQVNPVDLYWDKLTQRQILLDVLATDEVKMS